MITIQKNSDGKWEWQRVDENAGIRIVGPFDTIEECEADIKKSQLDIITIQKNDRGEWEWERIQKDGRISGVGPFDTVEECKADIKRLGLDKENVFIAGKEENGMNNENRDKAGIDHIVTLDELEQFDINSLLKEFKSVDPRSINWHFTNLIEQNFVEKSDALDLLRGLISFSLALDDPDDPFKPVFVGSDGTRTLVPLDFKKEQIDVIAKLARTVDNPGLRARLADVCWFVQKDPNMAEIAIDAYRESVEKVRESEAVFLDGSSFGDSFIDDSSLGTSAKDMMYRAAQISNATKWKPEASQRFKSLLANLLKDAEKKEDGNGFHLMGLISLKYENKIPQIERLAEIAEKLATKPVHPNLQNDLLRLADEARQKIKSKLKEDYDDEGKEEPSYNNDLKVIKTKLDSLIINSPTSRIAPAFSFGDDGLLHVSSPPDLQDAASGNKLFEELKAAKDKLKQTLDGTNEYPTLLEAVKQYDQVFSDERISISFLYARGIRLENAIDATRKSIESGEFTHFSADMEEAINSALELHRAYIMSQEEGKALVKATDAYRQSPQQIEKFRIEAEKINFFITEDTILFGEDIKKQVADVTQDIGKGTHPERSNQVATNVFISLTSGLVVSAFEASIPGASLTTLMTGAMDVIWSFLSIAIPLLKVIVAPVAGDASWVASLSDLVDRIKNLQKPSDLTISEIEVTHRVYQNWTAKRARIHIAGCEQDEKQDGGSGKNSRWHSCSSYEEAERIMNSFGYEDIGNCTFCM